MVYRWNVKVPRLTGDETRRAFIYTPTSYRSEPEKRYPVLYMFDGQNVFFDSDATYGKCWGIKDYLDRTHTDLIVAAVECNRSPENLRLSEYAPFDFDDPEYGAFTGNGKLTMDWFVHSFKSRIDRNFRTIPDRDHTFISGSSMGGLMSIYALTKYNRYFSKAAALSPSLLFNEEPLAALIARTKFNPNTTLYMDYGSEEFTYEERMPEIFHRYCGLFMEKNVFLTGRIVPGGTHCEASWERQVPIFMNTLMFGMNDN